MKLLLICKSVLICKNVSGLRSRSVVRQFENMKKHFPVFAIFILFVWGCASTETIESTKVAPTEIYQDYSIEASRSQTNVTATFRVGGGRGTTVDLNAPSRIEHNGTTMSEKPSSFLKGTTYYSSSSRFEPAHLFVFTDANGKTYRNEIRLELLDVVGNNFNLSPSETSRIPLSRSVRNDENISVSLDSEAKPSAAITNANVDSENVPSYSLSYVATLDEIGSTLIIDRHQLRKFIPGKARLNIEVRKAESVKDATDKGGSISFVYRTGATVNVLQ